MATAEKSAAQRVYEGVRASIIGGDYAPGAVLSRPVIATEYGISQMPVREAFLRLDADALVSVRPQAPTVVAPIRVLDVHQAYFLRRALTVEVVRGLARKPEVRNLGPVRAAVEAFGADGSLDGQDKCYAALFEAVGMLDLLFRAGALMIPLERCRALSEAGETAAPQARRDLAEILLRIEAGDVDGAVRAAEAHLVGDLAQLDSLRRERPEYFSAE